MSTENAENAESDFSKMTDAGWDQVQHHIVWPLGFGGQRVVDISIDALRRDPFGYGFLGRWVTAPNLRAISAVL